MHRIQIPNHILVVRYISGDYLPASSRFPRSKPSLPILPPSYAEFIAAHTATKQILWARNFLLELGFPQLHPTSLFEDNMSTIQIVNQPGNNGRTKHIALRYNVIREQVERQIITLQHLSGIDMPSDLLMKALGPAPFLHLRPRILGMYDMRISPNNTPFSYYVR